MKFNETIGNGTKQLEMKRNKFGLYKPAQQEMLCKSKSSQVCNETS